RTQRVRKSGLVAAILQRGVQIEEDVVVAEHPALALAGAHGGWTFAQEIAYEHEARALELGIEVFARLEHCLHRVAKFVRRCALVLVGRSLEPRSAAVLETRTLRRERRERVA